MGEKMRRKFADGDERGYEFLVEDAERTKYDEEEEDALDDWICVDNMHVKDSPYKDEEKIKKDRKGAFVLNDVLVNQMMLNFLVLMTFVQITLNGIQRASRFEFK